jgi:hypothetical protein
VSIRSRATGQSRRNIAVDVDERLQMFDLADLLKRGALRQNKNADIGDILPDLDRFRILIIDGIADEDGPELAIEQESVVETCVSMLPILGVAVVCAVRAYA